MRHDDFSALAFVVAVAAALLLCVLALWMMARARAPTKPITLAGERVSFAARLRSALARLGRFIRRVGELVRTSTRRLQDEHWVLLLGEAGSGKSSLVRSLDAVRTGRFAPAATRPDLPLSAWHDLPGGTLIDPDGRLSAAAAGSADHGRWIDTLRALRDLRPERALDGVVLVVSARTLLATDAGTRRLLACDARRQLADLRDQLQLVAPVYVVVAQADAIDGFRAYWAAMPATLGVQINGWSAGAEQAQALPADWIAAAWAAMERSLVVRQLQAAAANDALAEPDAFFLHPRSFAALLPPLRAYLAEVFTEPAWERVFSCRGVFLAGTLAAPAAAAGPRSDIAFVEDLLQRKVLAEHGLARATWQSIWSRDRTLRTLQVGVVALFASLALALSASAWLLSRHVDRVEQGLAEIRHAPLASSADGHCTSKTAVDAALGQAAAIEPGLASWTMPLSWFDRRASDRVVQGVARRVVADTVYAALACGLRQRAEQLRTALPQPTAATELEAIPVDGLAYASLRATLQVQADAVRQLEDNLARFARLGRIGSEPAADKLRELDALNRYVYGSPLAAPAANGDGAVLPALDVARYDDLPTLPPGTRESFARQLRALSMQMNAALLHDVRLGPALLRDAETLHAPAAPPTARFAAWLSWVDRSWLSSDATNDPCAQGAALVRTTLEPLVADGRYPPALLSALPAFDSTRCRAPSMRVLQDMTMSPYGALAVRADRRWILNPRLGAELAGLRALLKLDFMRLEDAQAFACRPAAPGWRTVDLARAQGYARDWQRFVAAQALAPLGATPDEAPLYQRAGAAQLERAMEDALRAAQAPSGDAPGLSGQQAESAADRALLTQSARFAQSLQPLLGVLQLLAQQGFANAAATVAQCVRSDAAEALARVSLLADQSRLYQPDAGTADDAVADLGNTPVVRDYLGRQVARAQVLAGYAQPFTALLRNTDGIDDASRPNEQTLAYWTNTLRQLDAYVQFKDPAGQVGALDTLFLKTVADLTYANCRARLATLQEPAYDNDLFSARRERLVGRLRALCTDREATIATDAYAQLAQRFDAELAGRYPFGPLDAPEAAPETVRAFFLDYDARRASLKDRLSGVDRPHWARQFEFIARLDDVADFLRASLTATPESRPLHASIEFRAAPMPANRGTAPTPRGGAGSDQIVRWRVTSGANVVEHPSLAPQAFDWRVGQPIELRLDWADRSVWRPVEPATERDVIVDDRSASFSSGGNWALLRLIDQHRPRLAGATAAEPAGRVFVELTLPVARIDVMPVAPPPTRAAFYVALDLPQGDTAAAPGRHWPTTFPRTAPPAPGLSATAGGARRPTAASAGPAQRAADPASATSSKGTP